MWNILAASILAATDVIRDDVYHNFERQFTVAHRGRMLRVLMSLYNLQLEACAVHCIQHLRCSTFNYHPVKKACELTDEDFDETDADKISPGWYNHGIPPKVNGGWSSWRNFTDCTKTCGNGNMEQCRDCNLPTPEHGGVDCKGRMRRIVKCNTHKCPVVNVALVKTAAQSSLYENKASYGSIDGDFTTYSVTNYESHPWWRVNLHELKEVMEITLRLVLADHQNSGLLVETRESEEEAWILCKNIGDVTEHVVKLKCKQQFTKAQFIIIRSLEKCYLVITEVEIFGF